MGKKTVHVYLHEGRSDPPAQRLREGYLRESGKPLRTVERDITRGRKLGADLDRVAGTSLAKGVELDAQADALDIEAQAKRRLADEYDAAQARGEVARHGETLRKGSNVVARDAGKVVLADVGITRQEIHEARQIRDAEARDPGVVRRTVDAAVKATPARARTGAARLPIGRASRTGE